MRQCQIEPGLVTAGEANTCKDVVQGRGVEVGRRVVDGEAARGEVGVRQGERRSDSSYWGAFWGDVTAKGEGPWQDSGAERRCTDGGVRMHFQFPNLSLISKFWLVG